MTTWIPLADLPSWTDAIGRLARTADGVHGTVLYFHFDTEVRVTLQAGSELVTMLVSECEILATTPVDVNSNRKG